MSEISPRKIKAIIARLKEKEDYPRSKVIADLEETLVVKPISWIIVPIPLVSGIIAGILMPFILPPMAQGLASVWGMFLGCSIMGASLSALFAFLCVMERLIFSWSHRNE